MEQLTKFFFEYSIDEIIQLLEKQIIKNIPTVIWERFSATHVGTSEKETV
jgi:hypothetical protein